MELDALPEHLVVIGGGYIGLEFGQMFRRFGSRVTVVSRGPCLLGHEDDDVADAIADFLREDCVELLLHTEPARVEKTAKGVALVTTDGAPPAAGRTSIELTNRSPAVP